jgi:hypothetical protein
VKLSADTDSDGLQKRLARLLAGLEPAVRDAAAGALAENSDTAHAGNLKTPMRAALTARVRAILKK